ncbi:hypothetical protein COCSADRAFT_344518 [Bipolaris sorokiniana ND90Pr]|uniref:Rhodopsin domain-containing protein n=1 Tax=Cochliobolus sativus (strain ND90Pr / ATCC 201652) TaxID=665912 RepID=M2SXH0_COCSN|nr:uncharacterized protein COCSADRAFT_344518 [Bipolaris sorokiniana ND90Pr]EMD61626.1 hypothetical protein COCSADRAFT_344518 [Bipolaris sorokiniana ND90Pr]
MHFESDNCIVRLRINKHLGLSDWLMAGSVILNFLGCVPCAILAAKGGQGRLMADSWWLVTERTSHELHMIFTTQCLNVYAMFLVKACICAYLMALDFGRNYRILIWTSVVIVALCNFVMMLMLHFDSSVEGECCPEAVSDATAYVPITSNIIADLIYTAAPIVYLRHIQLSKQTQWGVRIVFLLGLVGTGLSVAKIPITAKFLKSQEMMWGAMDLSICSINEVCVGIIVANLPSLRNTILNLFSESIPVSSSTAMRVSQKPTSHFDIVSSHYASKGHTKLQDDEDESERCILELGERRQNWSIMKTTRVDVRNEGATSCQISPAQKPF